MDMYIKGNWHSTV